MCILSPSCYFRPSYSSYLCCINLERVLRSGVTQFVWWSLIYSFPWSSICLTPAGLVSPLTASAVRPPTDRRESWPIMSNVKRWQYCTKMGACLMLAVLLSHLRVQPCALEMFAPYPTVQVLVPEGELMAAFCPQHDVSVWHGSKQKCHLSYRKTTPPAGWQLPRVSEPSQTWPPHYICI